MKHQHIYDSEGKQLCCTLEHKIYSKAEHTHNHTHEHSHEHTHEHGLELNEIIPTIVSLVLFIATLIIHHWLNPQWFSHSVKLFMYLAAYLPVAFPVCMQAIKSIKKGEFFTEFFLMSIATIGAFAIGEYPEAVTVMLFYAIGEVFQTLAVKRAKSNIESLLDQRPSMVTKVEGNTQQTVKAKTIEIGNELFLKPGDKVALDGILVSTATTFNTASLTGESVPQLIKPGEMVLAGMINLKSTAQIKVTAKYSDSRLSKLLEAIQEASAQKAPTELFIRKFAKIYTPLVVVFALLICTLPWLFVSHYVFEQWLYRALIFLVISCPCALVISIPLGYFGGISAASRNGILIKGGNFMEILAGKISIFLDKTGTITEGVFKVQNISILPHIDNSKILQMVYAMESNSTHPIAEAICNFIGKPKEAITIHNFEEIAGYGLKGNIEGKEILVGKPALLTQHGINSIPIQINQTHTIVAIAFNNEYVGHIALADEIKADAKQAIDMLHKFGINITMLSGDKSTVVSNVAKLLNIQNAYGDLLPDDKLNHVKQSKNNETKTVFIGDGVNDAPSIAISDVGVAMGGLGSDAAIEVADVVIQNDQLVKIPLAINISKTTKHVVWQNVFMAFGVKLIVLILGAGGVATMWEAVFADVGVALLAIINAMRIQYKKF